MFSYWIDGAGVRHEIPQQNFCKGCGGITEMRIKGQVIPPDQWKYYGVVGDCGCWCHVEFGNPQNLTVAK